MLLECVVIRRVVREARMLLFGFALCTRVADRIMEEKRRAAPAFERGKVGRIRAIGQCGGAGPDNIIPI